MTELVRMSTCKKCLHEVLFWRGVWLHVRWSGNRHLLPRIPYGVTKCLQGSKRVQENYSQRCGCLDPQPSDKIIELLND